MSDSKISSLTELTSIATDDEFVIVDKSDTSMAVSGTTKKVKTSSIIDTDGTLAGNLDSKVASQKATKTYADTKIPSSYIDTDGTLAANSDTKIPSQKAVKTYADTKVSISSASQVLQAGGGTDATTSSSTASDLAGCSITLTTTTKPVLIIASMNIQGNGSGIAKLILDKDGSTVAYHSISCVNAEKRCVSFSYVDTPTAGSHTYKLRWLSDNNSTTMSNLPGSDGSQWWRRITLMEVGN